MTSEQKQAWIEHQLRRALDSRDTIESSKKSAVSEYDARIRKLDAFQRHIRVTAADSNQLELFSAEQMLTPDISLLLSDPLHGL
jgi:hypothetical protein